MTEDYYRSEERPGGDRQLVESGWRREIGQLVRFEAAMAPWDWDAIERVLDLGCGAGRLANYMAETGRDARYVGVESRPSAVEYARDHVPEGAEIRRGDLFDDAVVDESFDLVVAIGAQVDGTAVEDDEERVRRVRRLVDRCVKLAARGTAIVLLDQATLRERPSLNLEPALYGATREELETIADVDATDRSRAIRGDVLETDLVLCLDDGRDVAIPSVHERAIEVHRERGGRGEDVAWLWLEAGRPERARNVLERVVESNGETDEIRHLFERVRRLGDSQSPG